MKVSRGGYESHLDFLEAHGFMTAEEREEHRRLFRELREHPERFRKLTLEEFLAEYDAHDRAQGEGG